MQTLSQRLLTLLQFTRIALVFTAISNGWAAMLLQRAASGQAISASYAVGQTLASIGLYTFGMALNDLIDRRRDSQVAAHRPLPSGRLTVPAAHAVCILLAMLALGGGAWMVIQQPGQWVSLAILVWTLGLIMFYDFAGKYLVAPGLLSLGLIRFFHAAIAAPNLLNPWHAVWLLVHVTILSAVCYALEGKRPRLNKRHWLMVTSGLAAVIVALLAILVSRRVDHPEEWAAMLRVTPGLIYPGAMAMVFALVAVWIVRRHTDPRTAGRTLMLYGLLWLILYDAAFVVGYVHWTWALCVLALLPVAVASVQVMRAWSTLIELSAKPTYQRAK